MILMEKIVFLEDFTKEENELALRIIAHSRRQAVIDYPFLEKGLYYLDPKPSSNVKYFGANYKTLYYNPNGVIKLYDEKENIIEKALVHMVLHCMCVHPSLTLPDKELLNTAADLSVNAMLEDFSQGKSEFKDLAKECGGIGAVQIYKAAASNQRLRKRLKALYDKYRIDDHKAWRRSFNENKAAVVTEETVNVIANGAKEDIGDTKSSAAGQAYMPGEKKADSGIMSDSDSDAAEDWRNMKISAEGQCNISYGKGKGNIFKDIAPPDRFSRFDYITYLKKFIGGEVLQEDQETLDIMMYTAGLDIYGDTPIVELCETKEGVNPSDIIIAIDMSGSCSGNIAVNFLRQIYTLFESLNILGVVNIHVVSFDTGINTKAVIRKRSDANKFISEYKGVGFGGTDFRCVFDYADNFGKVSKGKKLKGLFFFSDAMGNFPKKKPVYPTTFFVPVNDSQDSFYNYSDFVPDWVELVKYRD